MQVPNNVEKMFGLAIAFMFPGLIGLLAMSLHSEVLRAWLGVGAGGYGPSGFETLVMIVLLAAGLGVLISGVRSETIDKLWRPNRSRAESWETRRAGHQEMVYQNLVTQLYRYAQFHGNIIIASTGLFLSWLLQRGLVWDPSLWAAAASWISTSWICWRAGRDLLTRYDRRGEALLDGVVRPADTGGPPPSSPSQSVGESSQLAAPSVAVAQVETGDPAPFGPDTEPGAEGFPR